MQPLIARRLKWRTRLPAEVTNSERSDAVAMATLVSWETPKGCHGIPSPSPPAPRSSRKKPFQMVPSRWTPWICPAASPHPGTPFPRHVPPVPSKAPVGNKHPPNPPVPGRGAHTLAGKFEDGASSCKRQRPLRREPPHVPPAPHQTRRFLPQNTVRNDTEWLGWETSAAFLKRSGHVSKEWDRKVTNTPPGKIHRLRLYMCTRAHGTSDGIR